MTGLKIISILLVLNYSAIGQDTLYPIKKGNLGGYINKTGKEVIPPQFKTAGQFSEGLAAVRVNGTYGYIDQTGGIVIKPQFDLALPFDEGQAKVFIASKPFFIDRKGNLTFQHKFKSIHAFGIHGYAVAQTPTNKYCLINRKGQLITDTVFSEISYFSNGVAAVKGLNHPSDSRSSDKAEVGAIDTTGKWIIKYGKYKDIRFDFNNGYATAERFDQTNDEMHWTDNDAVLDPKGNLKFIQPVYKYFLSWAFEGFNDGLAVVSIAQKSGKGRDYYEGVINTDGQILFSDTSWKTITPFTYGRAFVEDKKGKWKLINTKGLQVGDSTFEDILNKPFVISDTTGIFTNGIAWVKLSNGWVKLDTSGKFLSEPILFKGIIDSRLKSVGDLIVFGRDQTTGKRDDYYPFGFWNAATQVLVAPYYDDIRLFDVNKELIYASKDGNSCYLNYEGKLIWQGTENANTTLYNLNIDFMNEGYFYVYQQKSANEFIIINNHAMDALGRGFYHSRLESYRNESDSMEDSGLLPKNSTSVTFGKNRLSVLVDPKAKDTIYGNINAIPVYIGNTTLQGIKFYVGHRRLLMKVQALNSKGIWKDIEYLPVLEPSRNDGIDSWDLPSKHYWTFRTPQYEGEFKTKLRIALKYIDPADKSYNFWGKKEFTVYSNEYEGSVNRSQFWHMEN